MSYALVEIFSYSIAIGGIIGLIRFKKLSQTFFPFIFLLWLGLLNEILGTITISFMQSNAVNNNIYVLIESLLILWLFKNWGLFEKKEKGLYFIGTFLVIAWVFVNFYISSITKFSSYYNIFYSLITVFMSIHMINKLMLGEIRRLILNSIFLISIGFVTFYTYNALIEIFWLYGLNASKDFRVEVYRIMTYINLMVNLIYAVAVLWIPKKRESLLQ